MEAYRIVCDNPSGPIKIYDPDGKEVKNIVSLEILPITCGDTVRCCFETLATLDIKAEKIVEGPLTLCENCWCMTHTIDNKCGKCGGEKCEN